MFVMIKNDYPLISCLILNWNKKNETLQCLDSVNKQNYPNIEIVLIDNCSDDGSTETIIKTYPNIKLIKLDKNYGCPGGRNKGIEYCSGEFIFFCDNDGILHRDAIRNAIECISKSKDIAIVTGLVKNFETESEIDTKYDLSNPKCMETNLFQGGVSLHRKSIYSEVGFYPSDYMYGGEETYLSYLVLDAGYKIFKSDQVILWHKNVSSFENNEIKTIQKWTNAFMNAYQLYPVEYFLIYTLYFFTFYPYLAFKKGYLTPYLKSIRYYFKRLKNYKRNPVKRKTYKRFRKLKKGNNL
ncbi:MAG TPA: hypothetical protein DHM44_05690 [Flexistipes sinusarabici]|uniref:Glycosyltransferase 2-like domain-containing protein n=1 Tax=Flexistipes sinusarabici TaxID=2352 RepID=A0A3D5QBW0_FLESI|nr:hypothetical protein [Flexistipes sinusarabici]